MDKKIDIAIEHDEESELRQHIYALLASLLRDTPQISLLQWVSEMELDPLTDSPMSKAWHGMQISAQSTQVDRVSEEYQLIFIGIGRGEVVPYASWYMAGALMEMPLAVLRQDLDALGIVRQAEVKEPEDHIAALLEVMLLLVQEEDEKTQAFFFHRHLSPWFERVFQDIKYAESAVFYSAVAELAIAFLHIEKNRFTQRSKKVITP